MTRKPCRESLAACVLKRVLSGSISRSGDETWSWVRRTKLNPK